MCEVDNLKSLKRIEDVGKEIESRNRGNVCNGLFELRCTKEGFTHAPWMKFWGLIIYMDDMLCYIQSTKSLDT